MEFDPDHFIIPLVSIYSGHAVQFSILVFISLLHLFEALTKREIVFTKYVDLFLIVFFLVFLFLLSSKLVIAFFLVYFLYAIIKILLFKIHQCKIYNHFLCKSRGFFFVYFFHTKPNKQPVQRRTTN